MRGTRRGLVAAGLTTAVTLAGLAVTGPAQAASCPANSVCIYENRNLSGGYVQVYTSSGLVRRAIPVSWLYDCKWVHIAHGNASSGSNTTGFAFDLLYINPSNASQKRFIGRMAPHKSYNSFGSGDDDTNYIMSPGCGPE
ncbi:peptidase inhibitor family I36 protein [Actinoplanes oblitus]|uniref:Peptidase inhibitor family I36 protein n=1 Tax=Actinoplanes oblitus TaxID=3040509 RepID=A0ABY8W8V2_9ACTN|nr:peptidase inhibitor family I36 protein [Actinoplanes oblitus]WIM93922.1 peptidase inhibitor family I36 protein [Actinoplanes oblitus]